EPHSPNPRNLAHRRKQLGKCLLARRIEIGIYVLSQQLDFGITSVGHASRFGQHGIRGPAALLAARERNYAIGAELVAAFNNGDIAPVRIAAGREFGLEALVGLAIVQSGYAALPCF